MMHVFFTRHLTLSCSTDDASSELVVGPRVVQSSSEYQKLQCSATGFYPEIQWLSQSSVKPSNSSTVTLMQDGHVKVYSEILVPQDEWNKGVTYTCQTTDGPSKNTVENSTSICSGKHVQCDRKKTYHMYNSSSCISDSM